MALRGGRNPPVSTSISSGTKATKANASARLFLKIERVKREKEVDGGERRSRTHCQPLFADNRHDLARRRRAVLELEEIGGGRTRSGSGRALGFHGLSLGP